MKKLTKRIRKMHKNYKHTVGLIIKEKNGYIHGVQVAYHKLDEANQLCFDAIKHGYSCYISLKDPKHPKLIINGYV